MISNLLRAGVILSLVLIVSGTVTSFLHNPSYLSSEVALQRLTVPGPAFPHSVDQVLHGQALTTLGLLILIVTSVLGVAISILGFVYRGDRLYAFITSVVLCLLTVSFVLGRAR